MAGADTDLVKILSAISVALSSGAAILTTGYIRARKELASLKGQESKVKRDVTQDETDSSSLKLLLESAGQWKRQYDASVARETRYRRLLAISDAKMRRFVQQAADDRAEDRRKIEQLTAQLAEQARKIAHLEAMLGGRRATDESK